MRDASIRGDFPYRGIPEAGGPRGWRLIPSRQRRRPTRRARATALQGGGRRPVRPGQSQTIEYLAIAAAMSGIEKFCATVNTPMRPRDSRRRQKFSTTK